MNLHYYGCEETLICLSVSKQYLTLKLHGQYTSLPKSRMTFTRLFEKEIQPPKTTFGPSNFPEERT